MGQLTIQGQRSLPWILQPSTGYADVSQQVRHPLTTLAASTVIVKRFQKLAFLLFEPRIHNWCEHWMSRFDRFTSLNIKNIMARQSEIHDGTIILRCARFIANSVSMLLFSYFTLLC